MDMNKRRFNVLHVSDQAKEFVDEMSHWSGIDRKTIADRVFSWLGHQPRELQATILMSFPQAFQQDFAELMLKRLRDGDSQSNENNHSASLPKPQTPNTLAPSANTSPANLTPEKTPAPRTRRYAAKDTKRYSPGTKRSTPRQSTKPNQDS